MSVLGDLEKQLGISPVDFSDIQEVNIEGVEIEPTPIQSYQPENKPWKYISSFNMAEISSRLGIPVKNVKSLVSQLLNCYKNYSKGTVKDLAEYVLEGLYKGTLTINDINVAIRDINSQE